jgi:hypothetical protein
MNKELITLIDDNNIMYVGEYHSSDSNDYLLRNVVTVGYNLEEGKIAVSFMPVGIPEILVNKNDNFLRFQTSKVKIESHSALTADFIEKYKAIFSSDVK